MAKATKAISKCAFSVSASAHLVRYSSFHHISLGLGHPITRTTDHTKRSLSTCRQHSCSAPTFLRSLTIVVGVKSTANVKPGFVSWQLAGTRSFASQTNGAGQSQTLKEYRPRLKSEERRQALRELEDDLLGIEIELVDAQLDLSEQELANLSARHPFPSTVKIVPKPEETPAIATTTQRLKSLTRHENIYTIPNILTFTRLLAAPAVGYAILTSQPALALGLFFYAGVTDAVDGYLARRYHQTTVVGTVIDPMADKLLMTIAVVSLAAQHTIPMWLAVVVIGRDVCLAISAIYFRYISLPPPKTFARYWDFSLPSAEVHPTEISKINTFLQLMLIGSAMALPVLRENMPALVEAWNLGGVFEGWSYLVGATTVWSGLSYIGNKEAVKILSKDEIQEKMEVKDDGPLYRKK